MKLISFAVPCYNSSKYMEKCLDSILVAGNDVEIIIINDGSTDNTGEIADRYANKYPNIVKVIHQKNGGHGEGVNQGIKHATGLYFKVVDSDDWADKESLIKVIKLIKNFKSKKKFIDLIITNYVYEKVELGVSNVMDYKNVFPIDKIFTWNEIGSFKVSQYLLMHAVFYKTEILKKSGLTLPKHTFYVDNIFVYKPLPFVDTLYYLDVDFYRYFIGRADQSVNETNMVKRIDQQLLVTKIIIESHDLQKLKQTKPGLVKCMFRYLSMMITISNVFLFIDGTKEALQKQRDLLQFLKESSNWLYRRAQFNSSVLVSNLPNFIGRYITIFTYKLARKIYNFN